MEKISNEEALRRLIEGNQRFINNEITLYKDLQSKRNDTVNSQSPFAVIIGCSDSRVPPEILFDLGIGDIFIIRTAGNIVDDIALGSIEYAVEHLGSKLIVVLGHSNCGAVAAAVKGGEAHGHIKNILEVLKPVVDKAKKQGINNVDDIAKANVKAVVEELISSGPTLSDHVENSGLKITGAFYDLESGKVDLL